MDLQVVEVVQRGAQSPAGLHVVHFLGQLGRRGGGGGGGSRSLECLFVFIEIKKLTDCRIYFFY